MFNFNSVDVPYAEVNIRIKIMVELLFLSIYPSTPRGTVIFIVSARAHTICYRVFIKEQRLNPRSEIGNLKGTFVKKRKRMIIEFEIEPLKY